MSKTKETFVACGLASALMLILSWPAFKYFFFAEAFDYLRIYDMNGRHLWLAAFNRMDGIFFLPGFFLADIWWHFVLPPAPLVYHIRNFVFCTIDLFLFYRVLLKFVQSRPARLIALGLLAGSKIYLTIIGYINVYEASVLLMTILLTVLFWFRYIESRRRLDYFLALLFCTFSVYSKDNGCIIIVLVGAMIMARARKSDMLFWAVRFVPFFIILASYLALRYTLIGPIDLNGTIYSPHLSLPVALWQARAFLATAGNLSLTDPSAMGERGFSGLLAGDSQIAEIVLCVALWLLILFTLWQRRSAWRVLIVPIVWMGLYLSPIFLIRNHQVYYYQEPLVGVALLVGICLDRAKHPRLIAWAVVVALIAINGFISNRRSYYTWEYCADRAEVVKPIVAAEKPNPPKRLYLVASPESSGFWNFDVGGAFIPHLLGSPDTKVYVVSSTATVDPQATIYRLPD
jgi:hypothetical protein